jgi:cell division septation protein DedD
VARKKRDPRYLDLGITSEKIRYGRATLTVESWSSVSGSPVAEALEAFRRGELSEEDVAWAFIRKHLVSHSPTFDLGDADLAVLLPRVTAAVHTPDMTAQTPAELILELEKLAEVEQRLMEKTREFGQRWAKGFQFKGIDKLYGRLKELQPNFADSFRVITTNYDQLIENYAAFGSNVTFDPALVEGMTQLTNNVDVSSLLGDRVLKLHGALENYDWFGATSELTAVARTQGFADVAEGVDATAKAAKAVEPGDDASADALLKGLKPMLDSIEQAIRETSASNDGDGNSFVQQVFIALLVGAILLVMQGALARMGIHVDPQAVPPAAAPVETKAPTVTKPQKKSKKSQTTKKASQARK